MTDLFLTIQDRGFNFIKNIRYAHSLLAKGINPLGTRQGKPFPRSINLTLEQVLTRAKQPELEDRQGRLPRSA